MINIMIHYYGNKQIGFSLRRSATNFVLSLLILQEELDFIRSYYGES